MDTMTKVVTSSITNTKLAIATLAMLAAGGAAFIAAPMAKMLITKPALTFIKIPASSCGLTSAMKGGIVGITVDGNKKYKNGECANFGKGPFIFTYSCDTTGKYFYAYPGAVCGCKAGDIDPYYNSWAFDVISNTKVYSKCSSTSTLATSTLVQNTCLTTDGTKIIPKEVKCDFGCVLSPYATNTGAGLCRQCTDSDNGLNYNTAGTSTFASGPISVEYGDTCGSDQKTLYEYSCDASKVNYSPCDPSSKTPCYLASSTYTCPNWCENGACVSELTCVDSDSGANLDVKGHTTGLGPDGKMFWNQYDFCRTEPNMVGEINEFICSNNRVSTLGLKCLKGCANGACNPAPAFTCIDGDGGKNGAISGVTEQYDGNNVVRYRDNCLQYDNQLQEYYCVGDHVTSTVLTCQNGCDPAGACKAAPTVMIWPKTKIRITRDSQSPKGSDNLTPGVYELLRLDVTADQIGGAIISRITFRASGSDYNNNGWNQPMNNKFEAGTKPADFHLYKMTAGGPIEIQGVWKLADNFYNLLSPTSTTDVNFVRFDLTEDLVVDAGTTAVLSFKRDLTAAGGLAKNYVLAEIISDDSRMVESDGTLPVSASFDSNPNNDTVIGARFVWGDSKYDYFRPKRAINPGDSVGATAYSSDPSFDYLPLGSPTFGVQ